MLVVEVEVTFSVIQPLFLFMRQCIEGRDLIPVAYFVCGSAGAKTCKPWKASPSFPTSLQPANLTGSAIGQSRARD